MIIFLISVFRVGTLAIPRTRCIRILKIIVSLVSHWKSRGPLKDNKTGDSYAILCITDWTKRCRRSLEGDATYTYRLSMYREYLIFSWYAIILMKGPDATDMRRRIFGHREAKGGYRPPVFFNVAFSACYGLSHGWFVTGLNYIQFSSKEFDRFNGRLNLKNIRKA